MWRSYHLPPHLDFCVKVKCRVKIAPLNLFHRPRTSRHIVDAAPTFLSVVRPFVLLALYLKWLVARIPEGAYYLENMLLLLFEKGKFFL